MCYLAWVFLAKHIRSLSDPLVADASGLCDAKNKKWVWNQMNKHWRQNIGLRNFIKCFWSLPLILLSTFLIGSCHCCSFLNYIKETYSTLGAYCSFRSRQHLKKSCEASTSSISVPVSKKSSVKAKSFVKLGYFQKPKNLKWRVEFSVCILFRLLFVQCTKKKILLCGKCQYVIVHTASGKVLLLLSNYKWFIIHHHDKNTEKEGTIWHKNINQGLFWN